MPSILSRTSAPSMKKLRGPEEGGCTQASLSSVYYQICIVYETEVICFVHVTPSWQERDSHGRHGMHTEGDDR